jgi:hypothetical protein
MTTPTSARSAGGLFAAFDSEHDGKPDVRLTYFVFLGFYTLLFGCLALFARAIPPPRPDVTDAQVAAWFADHRTGIQMGFVVLLMVAGGAAISNGIIGYFMLRMSSGKVLAYAFIGAMGVGAVPGFMLLAISWLAAVFRPDRPPAQLHLLYDLGMLSFNGSLGCFTAAYIALAIAILYDKNRIFPKWFAYVQIWQVVTEVLASQMFLYRSGVYSWNGATTFWVDLVVFGAWAVCLVPLLWMSLKSEPDDLPGIYEPEAAR